MKFFHLSQRYTVAAKRRTDGHYSVSICQCKPSGTYSAQLGSRIAAHRLKHGRFFVQSRVALVATLRTLQQNARSAP